MIFPYCPDVILDPPCPPLSFWQVPDLNNYPMFSVKCLEATESLAKKADALHTLVLPLKQAIYARGLPLK